MITLEKKNTWKTYTAKQAKDCDAFCKGYIDFLSSAKTEREAVEVMEAEMKAAGYRPLDDYIAKGTPLKKGDKVYRINMKKGVVMFNLGSDDLEDGLNILGAHIDSPRLDVKSDPLYEAGGFALLDTHYYGGIKKYQWVTLPLAIHGVIAKKDGTVVKIAVGEKPDDPVFFVSDLLIHLAQEQMVKPAAKVIEGEALDVIVGNRPLRFGKAAKDAKEKGFGRKGRRQERRPRHPQKTVRRDGRRLPQCRTRSGSGRTGPRSRVRPQHDPVLRAGRPRLRLRFLRSHACRKECETDGLLHPRRQRGNRQRRCHGHAVQIL